MNRIAYLAHPIDQMTDNQAADMLGPLMGITELLNSMEYGVYDPMAWAVPPDAGPDPRIQDVNDTALHAADLLVAYLPAGTSTIGTPMEIAEACFYNIPVLVITDIGRSSQALARPGITVCPVSLDDEEVWAQIQKALKGLDDAVVEKHLQRTMDRLASMEGAIRVVLTDGGDLPTRAYVDDAGLDLTTAVEHTIEPGQFIDIPTQVERVQLPPGYWGLITGRSSTLRQRRLHIPIAVIDPGWRGALYVGCWNLSGVPVTVKPGERLAQLILVPNNPAPMVSVKEVDEALRGLSGFGSTG